MVRLLPGSTLGVRANGRNQNANGCFSVKGSVVRIFRLGSILTANDKIYDASSVGIAASSTCASMRFF